jgi:hypothetical protein
MSAATRRLDVGRILDRDLAPGAAHARAARTTVAARSSPTGTAIAARSAATGHGKNHGRTRSTGAAIAA